MWKSSRFRISFSLLMVYLAVMSVYFWKKQYYNWDIEAYMGIIYQLDDPKMPVSKIHQKVYAELKTEAPQIFSFPQTEEKTVGANDYYRVLSQNPDAYGEELELFRVKPLYNWLNYIFYKLSFSASKATAVTVILSFLLIICAIFVLLSKLWNNSMLSLLITVLISLFKPLQDATRHAAPDMTAALFLLISFYFFFSKRNWPLFTFFAMLTLLTRPEFLILYGVFLFGIFIFSNASKFKKDMLASMVFMSLTFSLIQITNKVSWSTLVTNQFLKVQYYPVSNPDAFDFLKYLTYLKENILLEFNSSYFVILLLFAVLICAALYKRQGVFTAEDYLKIILIGSICFAVFIRFLIFPMLVNRMMVGFYLLIILVLMTLFKKLATNQN